MKKKLLIGLSFIFCILGVIGFFIKKNNESKDKIAFLNKEFHFDKKSKKDGFKGIIESLVQNIEALGVNFSKTNYEEEKNKSNTMKYYDFDFKKIETLLSEKSKLKYKIIRSKEISRLPELNEKMVTSSYLRWGLSIRI